MAKTSSIKATRSIGGNIAVFFVLLVLALFTALPVIYSIINALKPINELFYYPPRSFVERPPLDNFAELLRLQGFSFVPFERYVFNSVFVSVFTTTAYILLASLAAYPMAKHRYFGKVLIGQLIVWAILFRPEVTAIPQYVVMSKLKLVNTYGAVIFPTLAGSFGVFLMRQFMHSIPDEILEAAKIDGAGQLRVWSRIVMPLARPAWLTLMIFTFQGIWNTTGNQFIYDEQLKMLPTAMSQIASGGFARAGVSAATAVVLMIPPVILYLICQNSIIETMSHSGLKG